MSRAPTESQTYDVDFTREQRWILHHRVVNLADEILADGQQPPLWLVDLFDRLEDGESTLTERQATELQAEVADYVANPETPSSDEQIGTAILETLPDRLD